MASLIKFNEVTKNEHGTVLTRHIHYLQTGLLSPGVASRAEQQVTTNEYNAPIVGGKQVSIA